MKIYFEKKLSIFVSPNCDISIKVKKEVIWQKNKHLWIGDFVLLAEIKEKKRNNKPKYDSEMQNYKNIAHIILHSSFLQ